MKFNIDKEKNFSEWYSEILKFAEIVDIRYPVKGMPVYLKNGYLALRKMLRLLEDKLDKKGHFPTAFPVVIPESIFKKESEHIKGFEEEVFWVTKGGLEELDEYLALRPTSETPMYYMFALWVRSKSDLPLKTYQTNQVYRYETKQTKPLIRGREIYWNEAHTAHATKEEALNQIRESIEIYNELFDDLAIPVIWLKRPEWDKFAGAEFTLAADSIMPDGRFLQVGTTHLLGQKFSKVFEIKYLDENNNWKYVWQTSYGVSMRLLGAVIMVHGDNKGLIWPSKIAPVQVAIVPIFKRENKEKIMEAVNKIKEELKEYSLFVDLRDERPGWKFNDLEMKGIPLRIEIGEKDLANNEVTIFVRATNEKFKVKFNELKEKIGELINYHDEKLREKAENYFKEKVIIIENPNEEEIKKAIEQKKVIKMPFCGNEECAKALKEKFEGLDCRGFEIDENLEAKEEDLKSIKGKKCICGKEAVNWFYFGKSY
ncbi:MAG: proline--tRNA ligase [Nanoarchaeota archaeon]